MDMRIKTITFFLAIALYVPSFAQLSIEACYRKAQANYPLIKQYGLIAKTEEYNLSNAAKGYLPHVTFSAQATYQSEVTEIPIDFDAIGLTGVEIPALSKDQYKMELALNQTLWDGGAIRSEHQRPGEPALFRDSPCRSPIGAKQGAASRIATELRPSILVHQERHRQPV